MVNHFEVPIWQSQFNYSISPIVRAPEAKNWIIFIYEVLNHEILNDEFEKSIKDTSPFIIWMRTIR